MHHGDPGNPGARGLGTLQRRLGREDRGLLGDAALLLLPTRSLALQRRASSLQLRGRKPGEVTEGSAGMPLPLPSIVRTQAHRLIRSYRSDRRPPAAIGQCVAASRRLTKLLAALRGPASFRFSSVSHHVPTDCVNRLREACNAS